MALLPTFGTDGIAVARIFTMFKSLAFVTVRRDRDIEVTFMFMYAAFMFFSGTGVLKVTINVFVGSIFQVCRDMICLTSVTTCVLKALRT